MAPRLMHSLWATFTSFDSAISRPGLAHYRQYFPCCYLLFLSVILKAASSLDQLLMVGRLDCFRFFTATPDASKSTLCRMALNI